HSAESTMECFAGDDLLDRSRGPVDAHVEVEDLLPHGRDINEVPLLSEVLLRDLDFEGLVSFWKASEEWRDWLAHLEVDGTFLGLNDYVVGELAVEKMKNVVGGPGAISFRIIPIEVVVVDEGAIEDQPPVGSERSRECVGGIDGGAAIARWAGLAF